MSVRLTKNGTVEIFDEVKKEKKSKDFSNLKEAAEGETFIVILLKNNIIEVYDKNLNFICSQILPDADNIIANSRIIVKLKNGMIRFYDKELNLQFTRNIA